jgi:hypothetical protein
MKRMPSEKGDALLTFSQKLFRSYVGLASTQTGGHVDRGFPRESVYRGSAIVSDLKGELVRVSQ